MIMGTSTCHVMNAEQLAEVQGMCGVVRDGIVPGLFGYEAGQTGVGDIFGWLVDHAVPPRYHDEARERGLDLHAYLSQLAGEQQVGAHGLVALDWNNGNRSVLVDHELSGLVVGLTLDTRAEDIYRALIEATAFGTRVILDAFAEAGVPVVSNLTAKPASDARAIKDALRPQITGRVRWRESIAAMLEFGVDTFVEAGPGKVLSGLVQRCTRGQPTPVRVLNVEDAESLERTVEALGAC
jgi:hypothetical protein